MESQKISDGKMNSGPIGATREVEEGKTDSFPFWVMSGAGGDFADLYSQYIEAPREFLYLGFLCCLGSILAGKVTLRSQLTINTRLYMLLLGDSGNARKSSSIKACVDFFNDFLSGQLNVCWGVGSAEGLQYEIKKASEGRLLLCLDEMKALASKMRIEGSVLLPCINSLFEDDHYQNSTKNVSVSINNAQLSILGASTIDTYETLWTPQFLDIGFTNRIFLVPATGERRFPIPKPIPWDDKNLLSGKIRVALSKVGSKLELDLVQKAREEFDKWYFGIKGSVHTTRIDTYAMRLMPLLAVNDGKGEVDLETIKKIIAIMDWQKAVREYYDPIDAENKIAQIEEKVRRVLKKRGELSARDLKNFTNTRRCGNWVFEIALKYLSKGDSPEIKQDPSSKKWHLVEQA